MGGRSDETAGSCCSFCNYALLALHTCHSHGTRAIRTASHDERHRCEWVNRALILIACLLASIYSESQEGWRKKIHGLASSVLALGSHHAQDGCPKMDMLEYGSNRRTTLHGVPVVKGQR